VLVLKRMKLSSRLHPVIVRWLESGGNA
jgi:hypothetical protein